MVILLGEEERSDPLREQRFFGEIELNDVAGDGQAPVHVLVSRVKCRFHRCQSPPKPGVRQVGRELGHQREKISIRSAIGRWCWNDHAR